MRTNDPIKPQDLRKLISQPESETLEFKARLPDARRVASLISAFANTNGGTLVVGVQEGGAIVGVDHPEDARLRFEQANDLVTPSVDIQTETVRVDDKSVLIIRVPKGPAPPYLAAGVALQRFGENVVPLTSLIFPFDAIIQH